MGAHFDLVTSTRPHLRLVKTEPALVHEVDVSDLDAVFRRFAPYVARIGARILGRSGEVEDLVQDVFVDAMRGLTALRDAGAIKAWLATVTVRHARRRLRRSRMWALIVAPEPIDDERLLDPSASAEERAQVVAIYRALESVSADARIAWVLSAVEGQSLEEVAAAGGFSRATAHRRIQEAQRAVDEVFHGR